MDAMVTDKLELMAAISNIVLFDTEKYLIHSRITDTRREIETLDEKIFHLQSVRARKLSRIAKLKAMISPIRELPGEIIAVIFSAFTSGTVTIEKEMDTLSMEPWNLSQVCSKWRAVALATPQLWNDARVVYNLPQQRDLVILTQKLATFFSHSGTSLLSLEVLAHAFHRKHSNSLYETITELLAPCYHRLQHISFEPAEYISRLFYLPNYNMKYLETIEMRMLSLNHSQEGDTHFQFGPAPNLREYILSMEVPGVPVPHNLIHLPWERLTKLHLIDSTTLSPGSGHDLLRQCRSLISCAFTIGPDHGGFTKRDKIFMAHLEVLEVAAWPDSSDRGRFFEPLIAPSLKSLSLTGEDGVAEWSDEELTSFILRSSCDVENFSITFAGEKVNRLLRAMPSVIHFSQSHFCSSEMLEEIGAGNLLPQLRTFICGGSSELREMLMMLENRARKSKQFRHQYSEEVIRTLKSVTYTVMEDCWVDGKSLRWLERIMDEGLTFMFVDKRVKVPEPYS
ncbi:hypothetical protein BDZ94DRAFT_367322 [Collybia nuda]|uniref:F-box domain-containing protein n=1 Tax=Collybia nuda TaxID=64659 RepID=A0A9P5YIH2_9AGAR|nr:hypothetical protein BDZ94DRAFT_367322 [Collybia nuda]